MFFTSFLKLTLQVQVSLADAGRDFRRLYQISSGKYLGGFWFIFSFSKHRPPGSAALSSFWTLLRFPGWATGHKQIQCVERSKRTPGSWWMVYKKDELCWVHPPWGLTLDVPQPLELCIQAIAFSTFTGASKYNPPFLKNEMFTPIRHEPLHLERISDLC